MSAGQPCCGSDCTCFTFSTHRAVCSAWACSIAAACSSSRASCSAAARASTLSNSATRLACTCALVSAYVEVTRSLSGHLHVQLHPSLQCLLRTQLACADWAGTITGRQASRPQCSTRHWDCMSCFQTFLGPPRTAAPSVAASAGCTCAPGAACSAEGAACAETHSAGNRMS